MAVTRRPVSQGPACCFRKGKGPALSNGFLSTPRSQDSQSHSCLHRTLLQAASLVWLSSFYLGSELRPLQRTVLGLGSHLICLMQRNVAEDKMPHWVHGSTQLRPFIHMSPPLLRKTTPRASRSVATNLAGNLNCLLKNLLPYISSSPWAGLSLSLLQP